MAGLRKGQERILPFAPNQRSSRNRSCFQSGREVAITAALPSGANLAERISVKLNRSSMVRGRFVWAWRAALHKRGMRVRSARQRA